MALQSSFLTLKAMRLLAATIGRCSARRAGAARGVGPYGALRRAGSVKGTRPLGAVRAVAREETDIGQPPPGASP